MQWGQITHSPWNVLQADIKHTCTNPGIVRRYKPVPASTIPTHTVRWREDEIRAKDRVMTVKL